MTIHAKSPTTIKWGVVNTDEGKRDAHSHYKSLFYFSKENNPLKFTFFPLQGGSRMVTSNNKSIIICLVTDTYMDSSSRVVPLYTCFVFTYWCIVPELAHGDDMSKASSLVCLLLDIQHRYSPPFSWKKKLLVPANGWSLNGPCFFFLSWAIEELGRAETWPVRDFLKKLYTHTAFHVRFLIWTCETT